MPGEKELEKREEKEEKDGDWSSDSLSSAIWALIIIWVGVVFLLSNMIEDWDNSWAWIMAGIGALIFLEVVVRLVIPAYRRPVGGRVVLGTIFLIGGASNLVNVDLWPLVLIAIGVVMLLGYFNPRKF
ncbi:MAG: hypothetical protein GY824_05160 [Delftia sp.]|nr:hypothetical protein [Delftia sp.]